MSFGGERCKSAYNRGGEEKQEGRKLIKSLPSSSFQPWAAGYPTGTWETVPELKLIQSGRVYIAKFQVTAHGHRHPLQNKNHLFRE